ncbi:MAG: MgtC/SapB family protein, partial [Eubacterium sp.]|nr:MgtC/SapB family protein [Eubacterium sp.]
MIGFSFSPFELILGEFGLLVVAIRLVISAICGSLIGINRSSKGRGAGFKTHAIVCIGSCLVMMSGIYASYMYGGVNDITRMAAQVISGVGFLGVGTIIVTGHNEVKGLTTAAGLWACAGIGIACGMGFYMGAIVATVIVLVIYNYLTGIDKRTKANSRVIECYIVFADNEGVKKFLEQMSMEGFRVSDIMFQKNMVEKEHPTVTLTISSETNFNHDSL